MTPVIAPIQGSLEAPPFAPLGPQDRGIGAMRRQNALLTFGRRASAQPSLPVLLEDAALLAADPLGADLGGFGEASPDGSHLKLTLSYWRDQPDRERFTVEQPLLAERSMAGFALKTGHPAVTTDLGAEKRFFDAVLRRHGVVAAINIPLFVGASPIGILGLYATTPRQWDEDEVVFFEMIGHLLAAAVARARTEESLRHERQFKDLMLEAVDVPVVKLDAQGRILDANKACEKLTQFALEEIRGRQFASKLLPPDEMSQVSDILGGSPGGPSAGEFLATLLTKGGDAREIAWTFKRSGAGEERSILLTGIDCTEKLKTEQKLRQMTQVARRALDAVYSGETEGQGRPGQPAFVSGNRQLVDMMLEAIDVAVLKLDVRGAIVDANKACEKLTQFALAEMRGQQFANRLVPDNEAPQVRDVIKRCQDEQATGEFQATLLTKDGSARQIAWTFKVAGAGHGRSIVLTGVDCTEKVKTEQKLRHMTLVARRALDAVYSSQPGGASTVVSEGLLAEPSGADRRRALRHSFRYRQLVAPLIDNRLPDSQSFFPIECKDISASGIALFLDHRPPCEQLVLALGCPPNTLKLICQVARVTEIEENGRKRFVVGCRFIGRCN